MADQNPGGFTRQQVVNTIKLYYQNAKTRWASFNTDSPKGAMAVKALIGLGALGFLLLISLCFLVYFGSFGKLPGYPELRDIQNNTASELYSEEGALLGKYYIENRINAAIGEISPNVINALVATEDARFFEHSGIDMRAWARVLVKTVLLSDEASGGGSTLSQQLAKNLFPRKQFMAFTVLIAKLKELFIAKRLEKIYTKEELLNIYLNTVPFSENIFGIKVAAQRFFKVSPKDLNVEQAATLVGMLKATTRYNPVKHKERATKRRNTVISRMARYGYITPEESDSLQALALEHSYYKEGHSQGVATYFREHLRQELEEILEDYQKPDGSPYNLYTDGLKIYTTLNSRMQQHAEDAVREHMEKLQQQFYKDWRKGTPWGSSKVLRRAKEKSKRYKTLKARGLSEAEIDTIFEQPIPMEVFSWDASKQERELSPIDSIKYYLTLLNTGFLAVDPSSGAIKAWVGGIDYKYFQYDHVKSKRQVGSTFKPLVLAGALQNGMLPCEYTYNRSVIYTEYDNWKPKNADGKYGGVYSMEGALSKSVNAATVEIMLRAGIDTVKTLAQQMGITSSIPEVPSIALGAVDASLYEMTQVYSTFANRGRKPVLHMLDRIETSDGQLIVEFEKPERASFKRSLEKEKADIMIQMMQSVVDSGTARKLRYEFGLRNAIAGKTGTTQNHSDGWFIGFTPKLVAGVWVGADQPAVHFKSLRYGQGGNTALPIWGRFMKDVQTDKNLKDWHGGKFAPLNDTTQALMECPHYLDDMPLLVEDFFQDGIANSYIINRILSVVHLEPGQYLKLKPQRWNETEEEYIDRMRRYNERLQAKDERRQKRKERWSKILFGKKRN